MVEAGPYAAAAYGLCSGARADVSSPAAWNEPSSAPLPAPALTNASAVADLISGAPILIASARTHLTIDSSRELISSRRRPPRLCGIDRPTARRRHARSCADPAHARCRAGGLRTLSSAP